MDTTDLQVSIENAVTSLIGQGWLPSTQTKSRDDMVRELAERLYVRFQSASAEKSIEMARAFYEAWDADLAYEAWDAEQEENGQAW